MPDSPLQRMADRHAASPKSTPMLLSVGVAFLDHVFAVEHLPSGSGKQLAFAQATVSGGMAANAAIAFTRLGGRASFWGRVGDDDAGVEIARRLAGEGVDVAVLRRVPGARSPVSAIIVDRHGERQVAPFIDASLDADPSFLPLEKVATFAAVLADVRWPQGAELVLAAARAVGRPAILDADVAQSSIIDRLAAHATHVVFSAPALMYHSGGNDPIAALAKYCSDRSVFRAVTLGAEGCAWLEQGQLRRAVAPSVAAVDTLGAGDTFHGAFALALAEGRPPGEACIFANAAAALKCTRFGGIAGAPRRNEVEALLATMEGRS